MDGAEELSASGGEPWLRLERRVRVAIAHTAGARRGKPRGTGGSKLPTPHGAPGVRGGWCRSAREDGSEGGDVRGVGFQPVKLRFGGCAEKTPPGWRRYKSCSADRTQVASMFTGHGRPCPYECKSSAN